MIHTVSMLVSQNTREGLAVILHDILQLLHHTLTRYNIKISLNNHKKITQVFDQ